MSTTYCAMGVLLLADPLVGSRRPSRRTTCAGIDSRHEFSSLPPPRRRATADTTGHGSRSPGVEDRERVLDPHSVRYMISSGTGPSLGWSNAAGTVPTTVNPSELHSRTAPALLATTALNCMAR